MQPTMRLRGALAPLRGVLRRVRALTAAAVRALDRRHPAPSTGAGRLELAGAPHGRGGRGGRALRLPAAVGTAARRPVPDSITRRATDPTTRLGHARAAGGTVGARGAVHARPAARRRRGAPSAGALAGQLALFPVPDGAQLALFPAPGDDGATAAGPEVWPGGRPRLELVPRALEAGRRTVVDRPRLDRDTPERVTRPPRSGMSDPSGHPDTPERGVTQPGIAGPPGTGHIECILVRHTQGTRNDHDDD